MHIVMLEIARARGFDYIEDLAAAGVEITLVTADLSGYAASQGFERHKLLTRIVEVPQTEGVEDLADQVRDRLGDTPVDGVLCQVDRMLVAAACLAEGLGVRHEPVRTVRLLRDKAAVRRVLAEAGLGGTLRWRQVRTVEEGAAAVAEIGLPVVIKPLAGYASIGVTTAWTAEQAEQALRDAVGTVLSGSPEVMVEEYVFGRHVSAEMLVQDGEPILLGFAERLPVRPGTTAELGGHFPARFEMLGAARQFVLDLVKALDVRDSPLHVELVITPTGPELIEVNGRIAGHVVTRQMELALGRSLTADLFDLAVGRPVADATEPVATLALRHMWSTEAGTVAAVELPEERSAQLVELTVAVRAGDQVVPMRHNYDRTGHALAGGRTAEEAARTAEAALRQTRITLVPAEPPADTAADPAAGTEAAHGRHVLLVLGSDGPGPERVLDAIGSASGRVSVIWTGDPDRAQQARAHWAARFDGVWHDTQAPDQALLRSDPVEAVVAFSPSAVPVADRLRAALTGRPAAERQPTAGPTTWAAAGPGHTVVLLAAQGRLQSLGVIDDLGTDDWAAEDSGDRTLRFPSALAQSAQADLVERATSAAAAAGWSEGLVRCRFPVVDAKSADGDPGAPVLLPALDDGSLALLDALHLRPVVATATGAALGAPLPELLPELLPRPGVALLRILAAPSGDFRVVRSTSADDLYGIPELRWVEAPLQPDAVVLGSDGEPRARLSHVVVERDEPSCREAAARLEQSLDFRAEPLDRTHVLIVDRVGGRTWTLDDGSPLLPPEEFRVSVVSGNARPIGPGVARADLVLQTDVWDLAALERSIAAVHASHPVQRITCGSERLLAPIAAVRSRLGLAGTQPGAARSFLDKAEMKRLARAAGIDHAAGTVLHEPDRARRLFETHGALVLKPRELSGSQDVTVVRARPELEQWLRTRFTPGTHLVEEFVDGPMCHIDAVVHGSIVAWDVSRYEQDTLAYHRGMPLSSCSVDDPRLRSQAGELLEQVIAGWQIEAGVLHLEAFDRGDRLTFCEVAARPGGGGIMPAFRATRGIDLRHAKVLIDAGQDPRRILVDPVGAYSGWTLHYSPGGRLLEYDDSAVADRAAYRTVACEVGADTPASDFSGTGLSTHVFVGDDAAEIRRLAALAEQQIVIRVASAAPTENDPTENVRSPR